MKNFLTKAMWGKMLLFMLAVLTGGGAMAVEVAEAGTDNEDPNAGTALETATDDAEHLGIDQQGKGATGSAIVDAELDDSQIEEYITKYEAWKTPMYSDFLKYATVVHVNTKTPEHPVLGEAILEAYTKGATTNSDNAHTVSLNLFANDKKIFQEKFTIRVFGVKGYNKKGDVQTKANLLLMVVKNDGLDVQVEALNGPRGADGITYVPTIPAGTKLRVAASALTESELRVASDNFLPQFRTAYLQRKACAITKTGFYEKIKKHFKSGQMLHDAVLSNFRRKNATTLLCSDESEFRRFSSVTGVEELGYTQLGLLNQIPNTFQISDNPTIEELIAITRLVFTKYARTDKAQAYVGSLFLERLCAIDFSKHPEIKFEAKRDNLQVLVSTFKSPFGELEFKKDYSLDDNDMSDACIVLPMSEVIRYIYETRTVDKNHENDDEARDAKSTYYIVDDCAMLTGLTAMVIGTGSTVSGAGTSIGKKYISVKSLTGVQSPSQDVVYYLTQTEGANMVGPYEYDGSKYIPLKGALKA